ncbi:double-strand break repair protein AddB [Phaeovulum sp.]|uniref:double-strand break repair protein AddB n=1 Tax=Phaeovulum sp. TaxID=2934796 RepID=UPI0039E67605
MADPKVFALPPGVDFPKALVEGLIDKMHGQPPEAMAQVQLYLNTARMQRRVRDVFDQHGARILPRMPLITDLGRSPLAGLPPAVSPLRRRLELSRLVASLTDSLPDFAPGTGLYDLADSLATLMAEMQGEGVTPDTLERLNIDETHAEHWRRSLAFIRIVARYFAPDSPPDPDARQRRVIEVLAKDWAKAPPQGPVIVAGSTGSRGATMAFMQAVANLPQGTIILPGFDFSMPQPVWDSLASGATPAEDHPQYRFHAVLRGLGVGPADVAAWRPTPPPDPARNTLVALALRPAPVTDQWMHEGAALRDMPETTRDITLIEAPDPRAEALAVALVLREAAENGTRAALITPDRMITRRVAAALDRWGIVPDDSAGQPLPLTPPGRFLRHVAALLGRKLTVETLLIVLKHPLTATGGKMRGPHLRFTRELELHLRRHGPAFPDMAALRAWAVAKGEPERLLWVDWLGHATGGLESVHRQPLSAMIETHLTFAGLLASGPDGDAEASELWRKDGGHEALRILEELRREAPHGGEFTPPDYADLLMSLLQAGSVRRTDEAHPLIAIWGTLEARVQGADLVVLAGLNEGSWPAAPAPDPWLSRRMRLDAGLLLPERQIGLSAHDFQQAIAAPHVVLSRARRDSDAETVPSRWLNRLLNLMRGLPHAEGPDAVDQMIARGNVWLNWARALDEPVDKVASAPRPSPRPPVDARPRALPVTAIKTLIRNPYAVYAQRILRLRPLDPLRPEPDPRLRGQVLHRIIEGFIKGRPATENLPEAEARLIANATEVLQQNVPWPTAQRLWRARIARIAGAFVAAEAERAALGTPVVIEKKGSITLQNPAFTLSATPDRIDLLADRQVHIYDYKSGKPPSDKEMAHFDKQLLLEAAMAERGAFEPIGARAVAGVSYVQLGGDGAVRSPKITPEMVNESWAGLARLIAAYMRPEKGYTARRAMRETRDKSDYDHLSRYGEWELTDEPMAEDLG